MDIDRVRLRTYRQVWSQERVIYQIERVRLPFPVSFRQMGVFAASAIVMAGISRILPLDRTSPVLRYLLIPGGLTWFLTKQRLDGKPPLKWLLSMLRYALGPKRLNRLQPMADHGGTVRFDSAIRYRLKG